MKTWKELAIAIALERGHALYCPFYACKCGAVERREMIADKILTRMRLEIADGSKS